MGAGRPTGGCCQGVGWFRFGWSSGGERNHSNLNLPDKVCFTKLLLDDWSGFLKSWMGNWLRCQKQRGGIIGLLWDEHC